MAYPILLGNEKIIKKEIERIGYDEKEFQIIDPENCEKWMTYAAGIF